MDNFLAIGAGILIASSIFCALDHQVVWATYVILCSLIPMWALVFIALGKILDRLPTRERS